MSAGIQASNYIDTMDEPWHATCRSGTVLSGNALNDARSPAVQEAEVGNSKKPGGLKPGWLPNGENRGIAKTHDNSI